MTVLPIPLTMGAAATACTTVQPTPPLLGRGRPAWLSAPGPRSTLAGAKLSIRADFSGSRLSANCGSQPVSGSVSALRMA